MKSNSKDMGNAIANAIDIIKNCGDAGFVLVTKNQTRVFAGEAELATMMMCLIAHYPKQYGLCCELMAKTSREMGLK